MSNPNPSVFERWATYVTAALAKESELAAELIRHDTTLGSAREALVASVLSRFVPPAYEIGTGQIVDSAGNHSRQIDVVIARRDFPILRMPDGSGIYLNEGVLATIEVKSELNSSELSLALENCASVTDLVYKISRDTENALRAKLGLPNVGMDLSQADALQNERLDARPRPATYVFGFRGYKRDVGALVSAMNKWASETDVRSLRMRHIPCLVLAEGCVAWRNDDPFLGSGGGSDLERAMCLAGPEPSPLRLLVLHLLFTLQRAIPVPPTADGIVPSLNDYLLQMQSVRVTHSAFQIPA